MSQKSTKKSISTSPTVSRASRRDSTSDLASSTSSQTIKTPESSRHGFSGVIIAPEDIQYICDIKSGMQGRVYKARLGTAEVAVKEIKITVPSQAFENAKRNLRKEVQIMSEVNHENICLFLGACLISDKMILVSELCVSDLDDYMKKAPPVFNRIELSRDICKGMAWLHDVCGIVHLDLKPANLLIDKHGRIKITDFGYSQLLPTNKIATNLFKEKGETGGTPRYMAPERFVEGNHHDPAVDVYSFAIILWEMMTLTIPFKEHENMQKFITAVYRGERPSLNPIKDSRVQKLMTMCWSSDPKLRPPFSCILPMIDRILLSMAIPLQSAQDFWVTISSYCGYNVDLNKEAVQISAKAKQQSYILPISVPWPNFVAGMNTLLQAYIKRNTLEGQTIDITKETVPPHHTKLDTFCKPNATLNEMKLVTNTALKELAMKNPDSDIAKNVKAEMFRRDLITKVYALERLLIDENQKDVDIRRFGKLVSILGWKSKTQNQAGLALLDTAYELCQQTWFYPYSTKDAAFSTLRSEPAGTFLVRFSTTSSSIALSRVMKDQNSQNSGLKVMHFLLQQDPERGFAMPSTDTWYPSIQALVRGDHSLKAPERTDRFLIKIKDIWDSRLYSLENYSIYAPNNLYSSRSFRSARDIFLQAGEKMSTEEREKELERLKHEKELQIQMICNQANIDDLQALQNLGQLLLQIEGIERLLKK